MNEKMFLPSNLKFLRETKGKSLKEIGKICGKSDVAIHYWEKGKREPYAVDLAKLSNYFDVSVDDLVTKDLRFEKVEQISSNEFVKEVNNLLNKTNMEDKQKNMIKAILENIKED